MFNTIRKYLNQPFYDTCSMRKNAQTFLLIAFFVTLFLWFFQPFGLDRYQGNTFWLAFRFGLITFFVGMAVEWFEIRILRINKEHPTWTYGKWLIGTSFLIIAIACGNYLFINYLNDWDSWSLNVFGMFIVNTLAIGIFPIVITGIWSLNRHNREFSAVADKLSKWTHHAVDTSELVLPSRTGEDLILMADSIYYLEAMQNYVAVYYHVNEEGTTKALIRNTLKELTSILPEASFFQCHRSFIVNLDHIKSVSGNSQGLVLELESEGQAVPVSRSYIPDFRKRWS